MYRTADSLDDLLLRLYPALLRSRKRASASRGDTIEVVGALLKLTNPRARISRSGSRGVLFSCLGELIWYLSGSDRGTTIIPYIDRYRNELESNGSVHGAYGPRLFQWRNLNQIQNVTKILSEKPDSRRAVIQLFDASDLLPPRKSDVPCTCTIQFLIRNRLLETVVHMRSNDACYGLPHDIFSFTMLQEIVARELKVEPGPYTHSVGSLHIYEEQIPKIKAFIEEGWQQNKPMPPMPLGNPWHQIKLLIQQEKRIRSGNGKEDLSRLQPYWEDLAILLKIYFCKDSQEIKKMAKSISTDVYSSYIRKRASRKPKTPQAEQMPLKITIP